MMAPDNVELFNYFINGENRIALNYEDGDSATLYKLRRFDKTLRQIKLIKLATLIQIGYILPRTT